MSLDQIKSVEEAARKRIEAAQKKALDRVAKAKASGPELAEESRKKSLEKEKEMLAKAFKEGKKDESGVLSEADEEIERIKAAFKARKDKGIDLVLKELGV